MDLRKAIEKLNTIDAKDFKKLDLSKLKEFNFGRIAEDLSTKPNLLIKFVLILMTLFSFIYAISHYKSVASTVNTQEAEIKQRLDMIEQKNQAEALYKKYISEYPKIVPTNQLIGRISEFAEETHINILSFSPVKASESTYVTQYIVNLSVEAKTYQDMVDFIDIIENSPYTLRINKWNARAKGAGQYKGEKDIPLEAFIEIGSVQLNDV